jgi:L-serine dehydratase
MESIREVYRIGRGPSSSHAMGPSAAARLFRAETPEADAYRVILYGSLAKTGRGHRTDEAVREALRPVPVEIVFRTETDEPLPHPNTMRFFACREGKEIASILVMSTGGGSIRIEGRPLPPQREVYPENSFREIAAFCEKSGLRISDYVALREGPEIWGFLETVWAAMQQSITDGLGTSGILQGGLGVERKARYLYNQRHIDESPETREGRIVCAYAFAAAEQNADCGTIVTAPTCGSCAVVPAVLRYMQEKRGFSDGEILRALAVAGIIGDLVRTNASVSGAECGCQAEIGTACAMAAAALCELFGMRVGQIEYAAEMAIEHHLGLTCDPIGGLVQIPCIERNAVAAMRAINALNLANFLADTRKISFDMVVETMYHTGRALLCQYRETSEGGLAKSYR